MGHYCRICGRIRTNEKFSGKGHKNHVCKDCAGKSKRRVKKDSIITFNAETLMQSDTVYLLYKADFEKEKSEDDENDELPF